MQALAAVGVALSLGACGGINPNSTGARMTDDALLTYQVKAALDQDTALNPRQIRIASTPDGRVTLSGWVDTPEMVRRAGEDVKHFVNDAKLDTLLGTVKARAVDGYAYDGAEASFELLARRVLGEVPEYFRLTSFRVIDERRWNARGELVTLSEATVKLEMDGQAFMAVAEGNGPVNALDAGLRKVLIPLYPQLSDLRLVDYKVRILTPNDGTRAVTRVMIESADGHGEAWSTVGVSTNVIDASYNALNDSIVYKLFRDGATPPAG